MGLDRDRNYDPPKLKGVANKNGKTSCATVGEEPKNLHGKCNGEYMGWGP